MVLVKKILRKNQVMITALAIMIGVAGYLNFAGEKIGEEDFLTMNGSDQKLTYEMADISDEDIYAVSLTDEDGEETLINSADIASLDTDANTAADNYLAQDMQIIGNSDDSLSAQATQNDGENIMANSDTENDENAEFEVPGEAVFTSTTAIDTLAGAKLLKEQTRAKNKETLLEIINNDSLTQAAKQDAIDSMLVMTQNAQKETDAEMLLEAKGYSESVVSISEDSVDVMIGAVSLNDTQTAQIMDIVQRKTDISPDKIIITVSGVN